MLDLFPNYIDTLLFFSLMFVLCVLFYLTRTVHGILKKQKSDKIIKRIKILEDEVQHHMYRSERRVEMVKKVVDGFDQIVKGVRGVIEEDERISREHDRAKQTLANSGDAQVIQISSLGEEE